MAADVLVIGGGLAGTWAAIAAAREGPTSSWPTRAIAGPAASPPRPVLATGGFRPKGADSAVAERLKRSLGLGDPDWMRGILDLTWTSLPTLRGYYDFSTDDQGRPFYRGLRGPEYMRAMRNLAAAQGVRILDHHPALELLRHGDGAIAGASGLVLRGERPWTIRAGAVVLATGGCAFASRLLGSATNTGDGLLMGVEAGADLSGMEFTNYYTPAMAGTNMARSMAYSFARWFDADDRELDIPNGPDVTPHLARALMAGPLFCRLDRVPEDIQRVMPQVQPNFVLPFDRRGIDAYRDRFEVTLHAEGTVRGIGGLRVVGPGLPDPGPWPVRGRRRGQPGTGDGRDLGRRGGQFVLGPVVGPVGRGAARRGWRCGRGRGPTRWWWPPAAPACGPAAPSGPST